VNVSLMSRDAFTLLVQSFKKNGLTIKTLMRGPHG